MAAWPDGAWPMAGSRPARLRGADSQGRPVSGWPGPESDGQMVGWAAAEKGSGWRSKASLAGGRLRMAWLRDGVGER